MSVIEIAPIVKTLDVRRSAADAFRMFVHEMDKWWPLETHALGPENNTKAVGIEVEPRAGGRVIETCADGRAFDWGEVIAYEPGRRFAMTWQLGHAREASGEVEVMFDANGDGCRVTLRHTGWERMGENGAKMREGYDMGWGDVFARRFADYVA